MDNCLLTRKEVAEILMITLPTVDSYTRIGVLTGYKVGSRIRYKRDEVERALKPITSAKAPNEHGQQ